MSSAKFKAGALRGGVGGKSRWPAGKIPRQQVRPKYPEPAPGMSWCERFCTPEKLAEMEAAHSKRGKK